MSTMLSRFSQGRDNNFNLIRIIAAFAVLVTHSFALAIGSGAAEPFRESLGMTIGMIGVDIFFITSGFLVTASLLTRQSIVEYVWARVLRIFPALLVMLLLTVFVLGVFFTSLPLYSYFSDTRTYVYLAKCSTLFAGVASTLPGVFDSNPYKSSVNGALWTMPCEVRMYAILAFIWLALGIAQKYRSKVFKISIVSYAGLSGIYVLASHFYFPTSQFTKLSFMFFTGAAFYFLKNYILLSRSLFRLIVLALVLSAIGNKHIFYVVYILSIAYLLFFLAYVPYGHIRKYNLLGDYSYGIYIYAFPVQQSVAALIPGVSVIFMILISAAATILLSATSWHLLERRALGLKGHYVGHTRLTDVELPRNALHGT